MNFTALDFTDYDQAMLIWAGGAALGGWILSFIILDIIQGAGKTKEESSNGTNTAFAVALAFGMVCAIGTGLIVNKQNWDSYAKNQVIGSENILKKYDVKEVLWQDPQTHVSPSIAKEWKKNRELVVRTNDDKKYIFLYSVDKKTSEPTLDDTAAPSGGSEANNVSAKSLLKK